MRQPTFFDHACPRFDHHVYWSGSALIERNASTKATSPNNSSSHARSSGRKPEFFWLERQLRRSISLCAMFQSPQSTTSRPHLTSACRCGLTASRKRNLASCLSGELEPEGKYTEITARLPKRAST